MPVDPLDPGQGAAKRDGDQHAATQLAHAAIV